MYSYSMDSRSISPSDSLHSPGSFEGSLSPGSVGSPPPHHSIHSQHHQGGFVLPPYPAYQSAPGPNNGYPQNYYADQNGFVPGGFVPHPMEVPTHPTAIPSTRKRKGQQITPEDVYMIEHKIEVRKMNNNIRERERVKDLHTAFAQLNKALDIVLEPPCDKRTKASAVREATNLIKQLEELAASRGIDPKFALLKKMREADARKKRQEDKY